MDGLSRVFRNGLGLLLLVASMLKLYWQTHSPAQLHAGWLEEPLLVLPGSAIELCFASLLLVGVWSAAVRWASTITFAFFACVATTEAITGSKSCGCFGGSVHISPWIMAGFDSLCVLLLLRCRPEVLKGAMFGLGRMRIALVLAIISTGLGTAAVWATHRAPVVVAQSATIEADADPFGPPGSVVLLDPEKMIGKPFVLGSHIDIGSKLQNGAWTVVLVHHDCDVCASAVPTYQAQASATGAPQLAIIEMPPYAAPGESAPWPTTIGVFGKLDTTRDWFATTPVAILVKDCTVQQATDGDRAATPDPAWFTAEARQPQASPQ